jgi:phosphohistidine phosphatase SixA
MRYRIAQFLFILPLILFSTTGYSKPDVWKLWKQPGVHAIMRHTTAPGFGDPENFTLGKCDTQRNLNEVGRQEARALGQTIREEGIHLTAIYSSQWCRCIDTATELGLGQVQQLSALNSFFQGRGSSNAQTTALIKHITTLGPKEKVLYVTHQVNTTALTGVFPASGQIVLFKLGKNGEIEVLGEINAD